MLVFAVMPPSLAPTLATDCLDAADDDGDADGAGLAVSAEKLEPMISLTVPGVTVEFCTTRTLLS